MLISHGELCRVHGTSSAAEGWHGLKRGEGFQKCVVIQIFPHSLSVDLVDWKGKGAMGLTVFVIGFVHVFGHSGKYLQYCFHYTTALLDESSHFSGYTTTAHAFFGAKKRLLNSYL